MQTVEEAMRNGWVVLESRLAHDPHVALMQKMYADGKCRLAFAVHSPTAIA